MRKIVLVVLVLITCMMVLTGCNSLFATPDEDEFVRNFLESIDEGDYTKYEDSFIDEVKNDVAFEQGIKSIDDFFEGEIKDIRKTGVYYRTTKSGSNTTFSREIQYKVVTSENDYVVNMVTVSYDGEVYKAARFNVNYASDVYGKIIDFDDFDIVQLLLLVFSGLCVAFVIFAIVLCAKSKVRLKGLWIPLIILIQTGITITKLPMRYGFNFHLFATKISSLRKFTNGGTILTVMIPLGAILFVILKKKLERRAIEYRARKEYEKQLAAQNMLPEQHEQPMQQNEDDF